MRLAGDDQALRIEVDGPYHGDPPPPGPPGPTERLWEHEVVELFVVGHAGTDGAVPYTEIELSPHGHHLVLRLLGVRQVVARELPLDFEATIEGARWRGLARLDRAFLPPGPHRVNAFALHGQGAHRRYLAWTPVGGREPDFHRIERFPSFTLP